jgi:hypothetical protein
MSHPINSYSLDTISILDEMGIKCGFRSNMLASNETSLIWPNNLEIPREDSSNLKALFA